MASDRRNEDGCVIDLDEEWMQLFKKKVEGKKYDRQGREEQSRKDCSIFRVPTRTREIQPDAYRPRTVSIGPYHHHNPNLKNINNTKPLFIKELLKSNPRVQLGDYVKMVKGLEARARAAYSESFDMSSNDFCEIMLLDGAFIIMFSVMYWDTGFHLEDPVINTKWARYGVYQDLLLIENQVPFFVLEALFDMAQLESELRINLVQVVLNTFMEVLRGTFGASRDVTPVGGQTYRHILQLLHSYIAPPQSDTSGSEVAPKMQTLVYRAMEKMKLFLLKLRGQPARANLKDEEGRKTRADWIGYIENEKTILCVTKLQEAGIKLKVKTKPTSCLDITFRHGVLEIPILRMYDEFDTLLRNLIALEQFFPDETDNKFAAYADFMDQLIDTAEDVALLQECGVVINFLGNNESAASVFNKINKDVLMDSESSYLFCLEEEVRRHCESRWNKYRAKLKHDYFSNPWAALSLAGALVVIFLTLVQAFFAVLAYFRPPPSHN